MSVSTEISILIVEDDRHFQETLKDALALKRLSVTAVGSGLEALRVLREHTPSVILLDVQLPDIHGFDLCRKLKRIAALKDVPVVFLSARYTEPSDVAEGYLAGAAGYLAKPVGVEDLWSQVSGLLDTGS